MRRWHLQSRSRRAPNRLNSVRCVLAVEVLETREVLSPVITLPNLSNPVQIEQDTAITFSGGSSFSASDVADDGQIYKADLTAQNGIVSVDPTDAQSLGLTLTSNG